MLALYFAYAILAQAQTIAVPLTEAHSFTPEIEGTACDREGNIYAVSFTRKATIGRVTPAGKGEVFLEMPEGSLGNGIRFDRNGTMFELAVIADPDADLKRFFHREKIGPHVVVRPRTNSKYRHFHQTGLWLHY